jgi:hypothetical protein
MKVARNKRFNPSDRGILSNAALYRRCPKCEAPPGHSCRRNKMLLGEFLEHVPLKSVHSERRKPPLGDSS